MYTLNIRHRSVKEKGVNILNCGKYYNLNNFFGYTLFLFINSNSKYFGEYYRFITIKRI